MPFYQNVGFTANRSNFVSVNQTGPDDELSFTSKATQVPIAGGRVSVVASTVTINQPKDVTISPVEGGPKAYVNNSVKLSYNIVKGDGASFDALETEVLRVLALARTQYNLDNGLVPIATATFAE